MTQYQFKPWHVYTTIFVAFWALSAYFNNFFVTAILCVACGLGSDGFRRYLGDEVSGPQAPAAPKPAEKASKPEFEAPTKPLPPEPESDTEQDREEPVVEPKIELTVDPAVGVSQFDDDDDLPPPISRSSRTSQPEIAVEEVKENFHVKPNETIEIHRRSDEESFATDDFKGEAEFVGSPLKTNPTGHDFEQSNNDVVEDEINPTSTVLSESLILQESHVEEPLVQTHVKESATEDDFETITGKDSSESPLPTEESVQQVQHIEDGNHISPEKKTGESSTDDFFSGLSSHAEPELPLPVHPDPIVRDVKEYSDMEAQSRDLIGDMGKVSPHIDYEPSTIPVHFNAEPDHSHLDGVGAISSKVEYSTMDDLFAGMSMETAIPSQDTTLSDFLIPSEPKLHLAGDQPVITKSEDLFQDHLFSNMSKEQEPEFPFHHNEDLHSNRLIDMNANAQDDEEDQEQREVQFNKGEDLFANMTKEEPSEYPSGFEAKVYGIVPSLDEFLSSKTPDRSDVLVPQDQFSNTEDIQTKSSNREKEEDPEEFISNAVKTQAFSEPPVNFSSSHSKEDSNVVAEVQHQVKFQPDAKTAEEAAEEDDKLSFLLEDAQRDDDSSSDEFEEREEFMRQHPCLEDEGDPWRDPKREPLDSAGESYSHPDSDDLPSRDDISHRAVFGDDIDEEELLEEISSEKNADSSDDDASEGPDVVDSDEQDNPESLDMRHDIRQIPSATTGPSKLLAFETESAALKFAEETKLSPSYEEAKIIDSDDEVDLLNPKASDQKDVKKTSPSESGIHRDDFPS